MSTLLSPLKSTMWRIEALRITGGVRRPHAAGDLPRLSCARLARRHRLRHDAPAVAAAHENEGGLVRLEPVEQVDRGIASLQLLAIVGRQIEQWRAGRRIVQDIASQRDTGDLVLDAVICRERLGGVFNFNYGNAP